MLSEDMQQALLLVSVRTKLIMLWVYHFLPCMRCSQLAPAKDPGAWQMPVYFFTIALNNDAASWISPSSSYRLEASVDSPEFGGMNGSLCTFKS